jgi:DNA-binding YbaB/EbfC family protein
MDIQSLMRQAQEMQKKMQQNQEKISATIYTSEAGGGMVAVSMSGDGFAKKIEIDKALLIESEKEILEDLIVVAFNNAKKKADEDGANLMKDATSGIPLPSGFKI